MDLRLYFQPIDFALFRADKFSSHTLGHAIEKATGNFDIEKAGERGVALVGVPHERGTKNKGTAKAPDTIRKQLYQLTSFEEQFPVVDLGNLRLGKSDKDIYFALRDVVDYLREIGYATVILGGGQDLSIGIAQAFHNVKSFTLSVVDAKVDVKLHREITGASNFISKIVKDVPSLFHLQMLGTQNHYVAPMVTKYLRDSGFDIFRLGQIREDHSILEPVLRNSHFLSFDISAVKTSDAPAHFSPSPNGFYAEEACLIARYAGLSSRLSAFGIFEVNPVLEKTELTSGLAAQMVWYFIEAYFQRRSEDPQFDKTAFTRYMVELESQGELLVFYHQPVTSRWWIEIFPKEGENWVLACSENDYRQATTGEIPDVYWRYIRKTTHSSK